MMIKSEHFTEQRHDSGLLKDAAPSQFPSDPFVTISDSALG